MYQLKPKSSEALYQMNVSQPLLPKLLGFVLTFVACGTGAIERVSVYTGGFQGNLSSRAPDISGDGRYMVFASNSAFVVEDTNARRDIYLRDTVLQTTELVSINAAGTNAGDAESDFPRISTDGRFIAFVSEAGDLVDGIIAGDFQVYVRDRLESKTELVSVTLSGTPIENASTSIEFDGVNLSADGRFVSFASDSEDLVAGVGHGQLNCFLRDRSTGVTELISAAISGGTSGNGQCRPG